MPLDPILANPAKMPDPLVQYNNALTVAQGKMGIDKMKRAEEIRNALNEGYRQNTDASGVTNWNGMRSYAAKTGLGEIIPGMLAEEGARAKTAEDINKTKAETGFKQAETAHEGVKQQKTQTEAFDKALANHKQKIAGFSTDPKVGPGQIAVWVMEMFADPVMGPVLKAQGQTAENTIAGLKETLKAVPLDQVIGRLGMGLEAATKQNVTTTNLQDRVITRFSPEHSLTPQADISDKMGSNPDAGKNAPRVSVSVPVSIAQSAGKKFGEVIEEADGNDFVALSRLNTNAPSELTSVDQALRFLDSGKVYTGAFAEQKAAIAGMAKALGMNVDNQTLANTQLMRQKIATNLMSRIAALKAQGVALTPMSNLDLQRLEAGGPQITDDPATLKEMFKNYRQSVVEGVARYEEIKRKKGGSPYVGETVNNVYQPGAATPTGSSAVGTNGKQIPSSVIQRFLANKTNPAHVAEIDRLFGPGTAKRLSGGN